MARQNITPRDQDTFAAMWQLDGGDTTQEFEGIVPSSEPLIMTLNLVRIVAPADSLAGLIKAAGLPARVFASAEDFQGLSMFECLGCPVWSSGAAEC